MERLVNQHQRSMKQLEKNLQKISATQRLSEAKLDRQKRELSLDLSKLQKTTRGLNDMPTDFIPRLSNRRGSLPQIDELRTSPRSQRRLSIASIPVSPSYGAPIPPAVVAAEAEKRRPSNTSVTSSLREKTRANNGASDKNTIVAPLERPGNTNKHVTLASVDMNKHVTLASVDMNKHVTLASVDMNKHQPLPRIDQQSLLPDPGDGRGSRLTSRTVVLNHEEDAVGDYDKSVNASAGRDNGEDQRLLEYASSRGRARRSSEPTISKHILLALENGLSGRNAKHDDAADDMVRNTSMTTGAHLEMVTEQDENESESSSQTAEDTGIAKIAKKFRSQGAHVQGYSRQRRKSEGDILKAGQQWAQHHGIGTHAGRNGEHVYHVSNDEVWDSVRKCRYIRGYDPPEMIQPADVNKFVFGQGK